MELLCLIISVLIIIGSVICAVRQNRTQKHKFFFTPLNLLFAGVFLAVTVLYIPVHYRWQLENVQWGEENIALSVMNSVLLAVYSAIRYFIADSDYALFFDYIGESLVTAYGTIGIVLTVIAPLLTFGFVISFFKNLCGMAGEADVTDFA